MVRKSRKKKISRRAIVFTLLGGVLALLIVVQFLLEPIVLRFVNRKLNEIPEYRGKVEDIDIYLWSGAYSIQGLRLDKLEGDIPVPFFSAKQIDLSIEWKALLQGKIVSEIFLESPSLNFVSGPTEAQSQTGVANWQEPVEELFPFTVNRFEIRNGTIHFRDYHQTPKVDIQLDHLNAVATGLTNAQDKSTPLPARFNLEGRAMNHAKLQMDMKMAPLAEHPTFDLNAEVKDLDLTTVNDFFKAYAKVDVEKGSLSVFTEMAASRGRFKGYVKPLTQDLDILNLEKDAKNPIALAWEAAVAGVVQIFENQPATQVGTQIPFSGSFSNPDPNVWTTVGYLLRNAFIRALPPDLNHSIRFEGGPSTGEEKKQKKKENRKS